MRYCKSMVLTGDKHYALSVDMNDLTIITPTTGSKHLRDAIASVQAQTVHVTHLLVVDGPQFIDNVHEQMPNNPVMDIQVLVLPENVGKYNGNNYYGHRVYSGIPAVVNSEYISFLDEDNWIRPTFAEKMIEAIEEYGYFITTCRRSVHDEYGAFICNDDFESIGDNGEYILHDTNTYLFDRYYYIKHLAHCIYGRWGADRPLSERVASDEHHVHIKEHLSCYRAPDRLYGFFREKALQ